MTTYGVGELSAINALAGAFAERSPVIEIVGTPSREAMRRNDPDRPIHHTLPGSDMDIYRNMTKVCVCDQAPLHLAADGRQATRMLDDVLTNAITQSKPAYISLPSDMVELQVSEAPLEDVLEPKCVSLDKVAGPASYIAQKLRDAERPLIIADALAYPFGFQDDINELVKITSIPAMSFTSGKGIIDENLPSWSSALPNTTEYSRQADLVLIFGPILSDTNTARWSAIPETQNKILFNLDSVEITGFQKQSAGADHLYDNVRGDAVLWSLVSKMREISYQPPETRRLENTTPSLKRSEPYSSSDILQDDFWPAMSSFLKPWDTLLLANGTPLIGGRALKLADHCQVIASPIWNAIGSLLPAAQGVAAAKRDHGVPGRTILFEGDGSFQVTAQAVSDIIRYKLDVTIIIINNAGYTYERWLNGMKAEYNDVPSWRYVEAARFFGADPDDPRYPVYTKRVETWGQLMEVMHDERAGDGRGLKIIDVAMDAEDVPEAAKPGLKRASDALK